VEGNGWLARAAFAQVLRKERHRSDRTGSPFSLVVFELEESRAGESRAAVENLKHIISSSTRDYDVRVLLDAKRLGVLLPDTPFSHGRLVVDKMLARLRADGRDVQWASCLRAVHVVAYPGSPRRGYAHAKTRLLPPDAAAREAAMKLSAGKGRSRAARESLPLVWEVSHGGAGAVAMSTPLFLDVHLETERVYQIAKRAMDIVGAAVGIVLLAPVMAVVAGAIKLTSKGPVLFKQQRVGYRGRPFTMYKFRTMRVGCDDAVHRDYVKKLIEGRNEEINFGTEEQPLYKLVNDPRITRVGRFLRKTSLDELPQLVNVLLGQMSLVGPRPPLPFEVESYKSWHMRRFMEVKPGITGLWQVYGRSSTTFDEMVRLDLRYAAQRSLLLHLKLIFKTFTAVFAGKGAL
jgi:lipopolysaccharide/colanic/teichoic acid biosynthesis glycosyltransferase